MIKCNYITIEQQYNATATRTKKGRIDLGDHFSKTELTVSLFSMKQEEFRNIFQKAKFKEPITIMYDHNIYKIEDYDIEVSNKDNNISHIRIHGYVDHEQEPEFDILD